MDHEKPVWILRIGGPSKEFDQLAYEIESRGAAVVLPTDELPSSPVSLVVVAIAANASADPMTVEKVLEPWRNQLVPVVEGSTPSHILGNLSHLVLGQLSVSQIADRIVLLANVGGARLAYLVRLEARADQWFVSDRNRATLLRGSAIDEATKVVGAASMVASPRAKEFVRASLEARRSRSRIQRAIAGIVAGVLIAGSTVAVVQRQTANAAAMSAEARAADAQSVRLAGLATSLIGTDPDLPWLLATEALQQSQTADAIDSARRVIQSAPTHQSIKLDGLPIAMASDRITGKIIIRFVDGSTELRSADDGQLIRQFSALSTDLAGADIAPGGKTVLVGNRLIDVESAQTIRTFSGTFGGWASPGSALIVQKKKLALLDIKSGSIKQTQVIITSPEDAAFSVAAHAPIATILDGKRLLSVNLNTGTALAPLNIERDSMVSIATSDDGAMAFIALSQGSKIFHRSEGNLEDVNVIGTGTAVVCNGKTWIIANNMLPISHLGVESKTVHASYLAHRGPISGIGALSGGRTVTSGADGYLRIWDPLPDISFPAGGDKLQGFDAFSRAGLARTLYRPKLSLSNDRKTITVSNANQGSVDVLNSVDLTKKDGTLSGGAPIINVPLSNERFVRINNLGTELSLMVVEVSTNKILWKATPDENMRYLHEVTADSTGSRVATASSKSLVSYGSDGSIIRTPFDRTSIPVWIGMREGNAMAVTSEGMYFQEGADPVPLTELGSPIVSAALGPENSIFVLGTDGTLAQSNAGRMRVITNLGSTLGAFSMRASKDGTQIAVLGSASSVVVSAVDGHTLLDLSPTDRNYSTIRDVALDGNSVWLVRADGGVLNVPLSSETKLRDTLESVTPRMMSIAERESLENVVTTIGAD
ncbi:WD40 repeat domain-containing protein [Arthrobacter sp. MYb227]|uniref:WD40 repeat domain-containing protein n=1 Tax=Arthrobacter sp. MYb227 TaxID=1848601 RepID=UPI0011B057BA|nr:hypothetical protein [Arthrobacter sp. MYb227]